MELVYVVVKISQKLSFHIYYSALFFELFQTINLVAEVMVFFLLFLWFCSVC